MCGCGRASHETRDLLASEGLLPGGLALAGWSAAIAIPLGLSFFLRGREAWTSALAMAWGVLLAFLHPEAIGYLWCAAGAGGLVAWGLREGRPERINLGLQVSPSRCSLSISRMSWTSSAALWA